MSILQVFLTLSRPKHPPINLTPLRSLSTKPSPITNESIPSRLIALINPSGKLTGVFHKSTILSQLTSEEILIQKGSGPVPVPKGEENRDGGGNEDGSGEKITLPICKIVKKKELYLRDKEKKKKKEGKERAKTIELNWAIDGNDLAHRLGKLKEFLEEGRRVEVLLAVKRKGGRRASTEECKRLLEKIRGTVGEVEGAGEMKPMEGKVGGFVTMTLQGQVGK
ncbi:hypothetical protein K470DRAFT_277295 [Piedraia hortae CBS 480.64]|uniref:Translation initiation factor 3 N-terminal domain-containing protein n=1 Tax=Piedraia hortae CBS 480.64 TaxID=1314780 RepID=A0A6A7BXQ7_9PEZI|nr:hypothetical protein K470DRAFT_277295 [Piedraia hortae CBS 480.64]